MGDDKRLMTTCEDMAYSDEELERKRQAFRELREIEDELDDES